MRPLVLVLVLVLVLAPVAGCAAGPAPTAAPPRPRIQGRAVFVAPIDDRSGALAPTETAALRAAIVKGIEALATDDQKRGRTPFSVTETATPQALTFALRLDRFDPEGSSLTALLLGFGAGRPGWAARLALGAGAAEDLGSREIDERSSRFTELPAPREAMLKEIAGSAVAFVRRRR